MLQMMEEHTRKKSSLSILKSRLFQKAFSESTLTNSCSGLLAICCDILIAIIEAAADDSAFNKIYIQGHLDP